MSDVEPASRAPQDPTAAMERALRALGKLPPARPLPTDGLVLTLKPREEGLADKQVPVEELFKKLTAMRDKLRVLEQRVNASDTTRDEKAALQARITQVYDAFATLAAFFSEDALPVEPGDDITAADDDSDTNTDAPALEELSG